MTIIDGNGFETSARVAGRVYHETQPVAGDKAIAVTTDDIPLVEKILPRSGILQRTSPVGTSTQIIAANVDMVLVIMSMKMPEFNDGFLNRALVAAGWRGLRATVVLNKMDLCSKQDGKLENRILSTYGPGGAGYPVFMISCKTGLGTDELLEHIRELTVVMTGPSGAGKSSLVKHYNPALDVKIGNLNPKTSKGRHTTVSAMLIPLEKNTGLIDTPGLRMFSIDHIPRRELQFCFPEFADCIGNCRFHNCLHLSEPGCAVKSGVENGSISEMRYGIYTGFMNE